MRRGLYGERFWSVYRLLEKKSFKEMLRTPSRIQTWIFLRKSEVGNIRKMLGKYLRKFLKWGPLCQLSRLSVKVVRMLPSCTSGLHKQSFIIRSLFGIVYLITFCLSVIHLLCCVMLYAFVTYSSLKTELYWIYWMLKSEMLSVADSGIN